MTQTNNVYCLKCRKPSCSVPEHRDYRFSYSYKLRVPLDTKKRNKFRKFLDDCPQFVGGVQEEQREMFLDLLKDVKYFGKTINGAT